MAARRSSIDLRRPRFVTTTVGCCLLASLLALPGCRAVAGYGGGGFDGASSDGPRPALDGARRDARDRDEAGAVRDSLDPGRELGMDLLDGRDRGSPGVDGAPDDTAVATDQGKPKEDGELFPVDAKLTAVDSGIDSAPLGGQWFSVDKYPCTSFCIGMGMANVASPEGAKCASGEVRPQSAIDAGVVFKYGCPGGCTTATPAAGATIGPTQFCYAMGQLKDGAKTDWTVGCFCK